MHPTLKLILDNRDAVSFRIRELFIERSNAKPVSFSQASAWIRDDILRLIEAPVVDVHITDTDWDTYVVFCSRDSSRTLRVGVDRVKFTETTHGELGAYIIALGKLMVQQNISLMTAVRPTPTLENLFSDSVHRTMAENGVDEARIEQVLYDGFVGLRGVHIPTLKKEQSK